MGCHCHTCCRDDCWSVVETRTVSDEAADQVSETAELTSDAGLLLDCARVMLSLRRPARAGKLAMRATEADGNNARAWEALAEAAHTEQKWALLHRACERWLALEPQSPRAKELEKVVKRQG